MGDNVMVGAMFQPHQKAELSIFVYVTLDLETKIEGTSVTINAR